MSLHIPGSVVYEFSVTRIRVCTFLFPPEKSIADMSSIGQVVLVNSNRDILVSPKHEL